MAFTRAEIRNILGDARTDEIENKLVALHLSAIDPLKDEREALKQERDKLKETADKVPELEKQLNELRNGEDFKAKYEKEHTDFETYKAQIAKDAETEKIKAAYRKLLNDEHISEKRLDAIVKVTDFANMKLDKDGNLENIDDLKKAIDSDWGEFRVVTRQRNARVETPPKVDNGTPTVSRARELADKYYAQKYGVPKNAEKE